MLSISKFECLCDELVNISAAKLKAGKKYQISMSLKHRTGTHKSFGVFKADSRGKIDLRKQAPTSGTYSVIDPMGLFHSIIPSEDVRLGATVWATPPDPFIYTICLLDEDDKLISKLTHIRHWKHPLVRREEIDNEALTGTLFLPPGVGPFPTIIDFAGTGGGIREHRGALLASYGFATLSLAFFAYKSLPKELEEVDINYFLKAIDWLSKQSFVSSIGIQANSFGGVVLSLIADRSDKLSAYCIINSLHYMDPNAKITENGQPLPTGILPSEIEYDFKDNALIYRTTLEKMEVPKEAEHQFSKCKKGTRFRLVASIDDLSTTAEASARAFEKKIKEMGHYVEVDIVPGGHLMEPPTLPNMPYVFSGFTKTYQHYGCDDAYTHCKSQELVWERSKEFFFKSLGKPKPLPPIGVKNKL
ncbi:unnamed protein product, partial [Mesorhabditis belari]|uniref:Uncharacterized protein n=1 Tax=Mesorhabditis belari TaxID=2138241 RepID=A0AAF3EGC5_9BILA